MNVLCKKYLCWTLKGVSAGLCVIGFVLNSYAMMVQYSSKKTVLSGEIQSYKSIIPPSIIVCNQTAFKDNNVYTHLDEYLANSLALDDFLIDISMQKNTNEAEKGQGNPSSLRMSMINNITSIYTAYNGHCFLIRSGIKVLL